MSVEIQAEQNELNMLELRDFQFNQLKSRVDASGTFVTKVNDEPDSGDLTNGECAWWYNGSDTVYFKARDLSGDIVVGQVKMAAP